MPNTLTTCWRSSDALRQRREFVQAGCTVPTAPGTLLLLPLKPAPPDRMKITTKATRNSKVTITHCVVDPSAFARPP